MPKYVNQFARPTYVEHTIIDSAGNVVGTIRIKPSGVLWKPKSAQKFYAVSLETFADWITGPTSGHSRTKS